MSLEYIPTTLGASLFIWGAAFLSSPLLAAPWGNDPSHNMVHQGVEDIPGNLEEADLVWEVNARWKHQYPMPGLCVRAR